MMFNEDGIEEGDEHGTFSMKTEGEREGFLVFDGRPHYNPDEPLGLRMITCRSAEAGMIKAAREKWYINGGIVFFMAQGTDVITVHDVITLESADNGRERLEALMLRIAERERLREEREAAIEAKYAKR